MKVRYIYSACIEIETKALRILTDPWFSEGIYDGSWHHFPQIPDPFALIYEPDLVYVSHVHPDHYDPVFLRELIARFGAKKIIIPDFENNYLLFKSRADGIETTPVKKMTVGATHIAVFPNLTGSHSDIDSALLVSEGGRAVLNLNDCIWNDAHVQTIQDHLSRRGISLDLLALGFTGAGPYPQTYFDPETEREKLIEEANKKKNRFFERYKRFCEAFPATYHLPFAGKYLLGGRLSHLNSYRGVADPTEVLAFDPQAIVLDDGGAGVIDLETGEIGAVRTAHYPAAEVSRRIAEIADLPMDFEREIQIPLDKINFNRLMRTAFDKSIRKSEVDQDYRFVVNILNADGDAAKAFTVNANRHAGECIESKPGAVPDGDYSELFIDYRYLYGLLTGVYHWNNAEVGSQIMTRRKLGTEFHRPAQLFLNFFCAC